MASSFKPLILLFILAYGPYCLVGRSIPHKEWYEINRSESSPRQVEFSKLAHVGLGKINGIPTLKRYLHHFGYLLPSSNFDNNFYSELKSAVTEYQKRPGQQPTGQIDLNTVESLVTPKCGFRDVHRYHGHGGKSSLHVTKNYQLSNSKPSWYNGTPMTVKYAFYPDPKIDSLSQDMIRAVIADAFAKWAEVIPLKFEETSNVVMAHIYVGFFSIDGPSGPLAVTDYPMGHLQFNKDKNWAVVGTKTQGSRSHTAYDLESVAVHEIGHMLGLDHSSDQQDIMYKNIHAMTKKVDLSIDDVQGVQMIYGPNPNFDLSSFMARSSGSAKAGELRRPILVLRWAMPLLVLLFTIIMT